MIDVNVKNFNKILGSSTAKYEDGCEMRMGVKMGRIKCSQD